MQNSSIYDIRGKSVEVAIFLIIATLIAGCSSTNNNFSSNNQNQSPAIRQSKSFIESPCVRDTPGGRRLAFFGLKLSTAEPIVTDYYYCNGISPAKEAGISIGDKINKVRGCRVITSSDVDALFKETPIKTFPIIEIQRGGMIEPKGIKVVPFIYGTASQNPNARGCKSE
jgi:hypothetical protein